jgi:hypothetical protein
VRQRITAYVVVPEAGKAVKIERGMHRIMRNGKMRSGILRSGSMRNGISGLWDHAEWDQWDCDHEEGDPWELTHAAVGYEERNHEEWDHGVGEP